MIAECISYPKSGRSWLRFMLHSAGYGDAITFHHDGFEFNDSALPPHDFSLAKRLERYGPTQKLIYLDRDPRDVMVSLYHQVTGRFSDIFGYTGTISDFLRDDYFGARVLLEFRELWSAIVAQRSFLHVSYEEMHADADAVLRRVLSYLNITAGDDVITRAVEAGRFENMKSLEARGGFGEAWLRPRNGFAKVREGRVGAFANLPPEEVAYLTQVFGV